MTQFYVIDSGDTYLAPFTTVDPITFHEAILNLEARIEAGETNDGIALTYPNTCLVDEPVPKYTFTIDLDTFENLRIHGEFSEMFATYRLDIINNQTGEVLCYTVNRNTLANFYHHSNFTPD